MVKTPYPPHTQSPVLRDIEGSISEEEEVVTPLVMPSWVEGLVDSRMSLIFAPLEGIPPDGRIKARN